jgi:undecaprenyl-diphosphatase
VNFVLEFLAGLDVSIFNFFNQKIKCRLLDFIMPLFTHLAGFASVVGICLFLMIFLPSIPGTNVLGAVFFAQVAAQSTKFLIKRVRPHIKIIEANIFSKLMQYDPSFPSAHTATITALGGVITILHPITFPLIVVVCVGVGISRIYLGQHYPSDVLVGAIIGVIAAELSCLIF